MSGSQKKGEKLFYIPLFRVAINSLLRSEVSMITFSYVLLEVICIFAVFISDLEINGFVFKFGVLSYKTLYLVEVVNCFSLPGFVCLYRRPGTYIKPGRVSNGILEDTRRPKLVLKQLQRGREQTPVAGESESFVRSQPVLHLNPSSAFPFRNGQAGHLPLKALFHRFQTGLVAPAST